MGFGTMGRLALACVAVVTLSACGDLRNDIVKGALSGTTANGAPVVGSVSLRDGLGITLRPTTVSADSSFQILLTGMVPPFIFRTSGTANGQPVSLIGVTAKPGRMNATTLSHLAVAIAYGGNPETAFQSWGSGGSLIAEEDVLLAAADIKDQIQPILDVFEQSNTDFMTVAFDPGPDPSAPVVVDPVLDGFGMDGVLQILDITYITDPNDANIFTGYRITNRFTGSSFTDDLDLRTPALPGLPASDAFDTVVPAPPLPVAAP